MAASGAPTRGPLRSSAMAGDVSGTPFDDQRQAARRRERHGRPGREAPALSGPRPPAASGPRRRAPACAPGFPRRKARAAVRTWGLARLQVLRRGHRRGWSVTPSGRRRWGQAVRHRTTITQSPRSAEPDKFSGVGCRTLCDRTPWTHRRGLQPYLGFQRRRPRNFSSLSYIAAPTAPRSRPRSVRAGPGRQSKDVPTTSKERPMADTDYTTDIKKYAPSVNDKAVQGIVKYLGIALKSSKDAAHGLMLVEGRARARPRRLHEEEAEDDRSRRRSRQGAQGASATR